MEKLVFLWHVYDTPSDENRRLGEVHPVGAASAYSGIEFLLILNDKNLRSLSCELASYS